MKVVFLDIDGVLIPMPKADSCNSDFVPFEFSEEALLNLIYFLKQTDSYIILSSNRRGMKADVDYFKRVLGGLGYGDRFVLMASLAITSKEEAIKNTIKLFRGKIEWVILDDDEMKDPELKDKALIVDQYEGFSKDDVYVAMEIQHRPPLNYDLTMVDPALQEVIQYVKAF